jgi:hypothetical protein
MNKTEIVQAKQFIFSDIERELALANSSEKSLGRFLLRLAGVPRGGGNFVAALSLLSYKNMAVALKTTIFQTAILERTSMTSLAIWELAISSY